MFSWYLVIQLFNPYSRVSEKEQNNELKMMTMTLNSYKCEEMHLYRTERFSWRTVPVKRSLWIILNQCLLESNFIQHYKVWVTLKVAKLIKTLIYFWINKEKGPGPGTRDYSPTFQKILQQNLQIWTKLMFNRTETISRSIKAGFLKDLSCFVGSGKQLGSHKGHSVSTGIREFFGMFSEMGFRCGNFQWFFQSHWFFCSLSDPLHAILRLRIWTELFAIDFWLKIERYTKSTLGVSLLFWSHPISAIT